MVFRIDKKRVLYHLFKLDQFDQGAQSIHEVFWTIAVATFRSQDSHILKRAYNIVRNFSNPSVVEEFAQSLRNFSDQGKEFIKNILNLKKEDNRYKFNYLEVETFAIFKNRRWNHILKRAYNIVRSFSNPRVVEEFANSLNDLEESGILLKTSI